MTITDPERTRETTALLRWLVLGAAAGLALVAIWFGSSDRQPARVVDRATDEVVEPGRLLEREPDTVGPAERVEVRAVDGSPDAVVDQAARTLEARDAAAEVALHANFVRPDREAVVLERATFVLQHEDGTRRRVEVVDASSALVLALEPGSYVTALEAEGFEHLSQALELTPLPPDVIERGGRAHEGLAYSELVYVWPEGLVAVVLRTPDGRSLETLADALGWEPERAFVDAFTVNARLQPPDDEAVMTGDPALATFHPPSGWHDWQLPGSCIGALELKTSPPLWVGLAVHGAPLGWQPLQPGQRTVEFQLDLAALRARLASVTLRVVDAGSGAPLVTALVTLRADTSAHRGDELDEVAPGPDGAVTLVDVVPGRYELTVERECAILQRRLELGPGERLDLGELAVAAADCVELRVVRADGSPAGAWIELAPLVPGELADELYPPTLSRATEDDGTLRLSMPAAPSIVRAQVHPKGVSQHRGRMTPTGARSRNVRLDPTDPPSGLLTLEAHEPVDVSFECPAAGRVVVLDALGLVEGSFALDPNEAGHELELVPGEYLARRVGAGGEVLGETRFAVPASEPADGLRVSLR